MSLVPMIFHNWWDDLENPFRTLRLIDQHFGSGINSDDLSSALWDSAPRGQRGYLRPWTTQNLQNIDSGSKLCIDKDKFQVILDVQQFAPNEITVKAVGKEVIVEGKHEERADEHGYISRHFVRKYQLPDNANADEVASTLSSDGVLTISAIRKPIEDPKERAVPITHTGPSKTDKEAKSEENMETAK